MVSLKKNDKIIIIVAVVVLAVSAIGVAMYKSPSPTTPLTPSTNPLNQEYTVTWTVSSQTGEKITDFAGKKTPFETTTKIMKGNLKSISFNMTWVDDHTTLFGRRGLDTLTLSVTPPEGKIVTVSNKSIRIKKTGAISFSINVPGNSPFSDPIQAPDLTSAQDQLNKAPYYSDKWVNSDVKITVSCKIGEPIFRPLMRLLDKGNDFTLQITYVYYKGLLTPPTTDNGQKTTGTDVPPDSSWNSEDYQPPYMAMLINSGSARFI